MAPAPSGGEPRAATTNGSTTEAAESAETAAHRLAQMRHDPAAIRRAFETGEYPYKQKMRRTVYEKHKAELQVELLKVQEWVKATGQENRHPVRGARRRRQGRHH